MPRCASVSDLWPEALSIGALMMLKENGLQELVPRYGRMVERAAEIIRRKQAMPLDPDGCLSLNDHRHSHNQATAPGPQTTARQPPFRTPGRNPSVRSVRSSEVCFSWMSGWSKGPVSCKYRPSASRVN